MSEPSPVSAQSYEHALAALYLGIGLELSVHFFGSHYRVTGPGVDVWFLWSDVVREVRAALDGLPTCPTCKGEGRVWAPSASAGGWQTPKSCSTCNGLTRVQPASSALAS